MNPFSVVENMTLETNLTMDLLLVNPIRKYKCLKNDLEQQEWVCTFKDLSRVKAGFKSVSLQFYFEISGLATAKNWHEIQNIDGEELF